MGGGRVRAFVLFIGDAQLRKVVRAAVARRRLAALPVHPLRPKSREHLFGGLQEFAEPLRGLRSHPSLARSGPPTASGARHRGLDFAAHVGSALARRRRRLLLRLRDGRLEHLRLDGRLDRTPRRVVVVVVAAEIRRVRRGGGLGRLDRRNDEVANQPGHFRLGLRLRLRDALAIHTRAEASDNTRAQLGGRRGEVEVDAARQAAEECADGERERAFAPLVIAHRDELVKAPHVRHRASPRREGEEGLVAHEERAIVGAAPRAFDQLEARKLL